MIAAPVSRRSTLAGRVRNVVLGIVLAVGCGATPARAADKIDWLRELGLGQGIPLVALPPGAGTIVGVDEKRKTDSFVQTITLAGDAGTAGDNEIVVTVTRTGLAPRIEDDTIATEAQQLLPNFSFKLGPVGTRNTFGLFGALVGGKGGVNCVYAWQGVNLADAWITGTPTNVLEERHALTVRYRLCRTTATTSELLGFVEGGQSGLVATRAMPRPSPGYDALSAATSLNPASMGEGAPVQFVPSIEPARASPRRHGSPRVARMAHRGNTPIRAAQSAENSPPPRLAIPDLPLP